MKRSFVIALLALLACSDSSTADSPPQRVWKRLGDGVHRVIDTLPENRIVYCYTYTNVGIHSAAISCIVAP